MTGQQKVMRTASLLHSIQQMLTIKNKKQFPNASSRAIRKKVAEALYLSDPQVQKLIQRLS